MGAVLQYNDPLSNLTILGLLDIFGHSDFTGDPSHGISRVFTYEQMQLLSILRLPHEMPVALHANRKIRKLVPATVASDKGKFLMVLINYLEKSHFKM